MVSVASKYVSLGLHRGNSEGKSSVIKAHNGTIRTVAFSRDGRKLITGSDDKTVKVCENNNRIPNLFRTKCAATSYSLLPSAFGAGQPSVEQTQSI
eukprot:2082758-Pyramimonas_sp.AAC.3